MVGARARVELLHDFAGELEHLFVDRVAVVGARRAHDVALHVAAGGQRRELHFVDAANRVLEICFEDAVVLHALPCSDAERAIADFVAQVDFGQELVAREAPARNRCADHEAIELGLGSRRRRGLRPGVRGRPAGRCRDS